MPIVEGLLLRALSNGGVTFDERPSTYALGLFGAIKKRTIVMRLSFSFISLIKVPAYLIRCCLQASFPSFGNQEV